MKKGGPEVRTALRVTFFGGRAVTGMNPETSVLPVSTA
jgi:hypothetical protein